MNRAEIELIGTRWNEVCGEAERIRELIQKNQSRDFPLVDTEDSIDSIEYDPKDGILIKTHSWWNDGTAYHDDCVIRLIWFEMSDEELIKLVHDYAQMKKTAAERQAKLKDEAEAELAKEERRKQWEELNKEFGKPAKETEIGFWTDHETDNGHDVYHCSICDYESIPYKICPNCGTEMKDRG